MIHLTNDAVQKYSDNYGKFEPANKVILKLKGLLLWVQQIYRRESQFYDSNLPKNERTGPGCSQGYVHQTEPKDLVLFRVIWTWFHDRPNL